MPPIDKRRYVFGIGPIRELLQQRSERLVAVFAIQGHTLDPVFAEAGVNVKRLPKEKLDALVGPASNHQGVVAETLAFEYSDFDAVIENQAAPILVYLDGVTDPHNFGAILRSAYLLGATAVVVGKDRAAPMSGTVTKASAGASELLPIVRVVNIARSLGECKTRGLWTAAVASGAKATPLSKFDASGGVALVLGSEGKGIRPLVEKQCDFHLEIPMARSGVGSFNVSVAAAVVLYEVSRQRALSA